MSVFGLRTPDEDPIDTDLPDGLQAIHVGTWLELIFRLDIPTKRKAVAIAFATFASGDGSSVKPGMDKVADMVKMTERNLRPHVRALEALGMLVEKRHGGGRGGATNLYRLTRPADITALPLWLDPTFDRVPDGAGFVPVEQEYRMPASGESLIEEAELRMPASGETTTDTAEYRMPASGESPVDNSADAETPDVASRNTGRYEHEYRMPASPDLSKTYPDQQNHLGSPQVSTSLETKIAEERQAIVMLVGEAEPNPWTPDAAQPPRIVSATAGLTPADGAHAAALAVLASLPGGARFFAGRAARMLADEGVQDPLPSAVAIRAAELAVSPQSESRSA